MSKEETTKKTNTKKVSKKNTTNTSKSKSATKKTVAKKTAPKKAVPKKVTPTAKTSVSTAPVKKETKVLQEENNYTKTLLAALLIALLFFAGYVAVKVKNGEDITNSKYVATAMEQQFKEDYEKLNGTTYSDGTKITEVEIIADNNIEYISMTEAVNLLDSGTGLIYFGFSGCSYCRNAVPVLLEAMTSSELETIYYVDLRPENKVENDLRDTYTLNSKNKAKKTKDAEESYYEVLTGLANYLEDYVLTTENGKEVNTGEKRLYAPTVVAVVNGEIVGFHQGTVEGHQANDDGILEDLTKNEQKELLNTYSKIISDYLTKK